MTIRIYYWFKGTPGDRVGGPWWYKDFFGFEASDEFVAYKNDIYEFCEHIRSIRALDDKLPEHDPMEIYPPSNARIEK